MDEPDPDEIAFLLLALAVTFVWLFRYLYRLSSVPQVRPCVGRRIVLAAVPLACAGGVLAVLETWADPKVRAHGFYTSLFLLGEAACLAATHWAIRPLGIDLAGDVLERANAAALAVFVGAMIAASLVYAGSNIGVGPTIWTTLVPAAVATLGLAMLWIVLAALGGTLDAILIDRDTASGVRAAASLVSGGLVLGRAAAGRFVDWGTTFGDLARAAGPALAIALVAAGLQRALGPNAARPRPSVLAFGILPAFVLLALGVIVVLCSPFPSDPSRW